MTYVTIQGEVEIEDDSSVDERLRCTTTNMDSQEEEMSKLFQIKIQIKRTKVNALVDTDSQSNLIYEAVVKKLGLETYEHPHPHPLGWVKKGVEIQVTRICKVNFGINSKSIDVLEADVIPLDAFDVVFGSPYLYIKDAIFMRRENQYRWVKDGISYNIRAHQCKTQVTIVSSNQAKLIIQENNNQFCLLLLK